MGSTIQSVRSSGCLPGYKCRLRVIIAARHEKYTYGQCADLGRCFFGRSIVSVTMVQGTSVLESLFLLYFEY